MPPAPTPIELDRPALFDTGVWTWVRDRRFPHLASWFNAQVGAGMVLTCELVMIELVRLAPNEPRALQTLKTLEAFDSVPMTSQLWRGVLEVQVLLSSDGDHRRVPPTDLLIGLAAADANVPLLHYDRDYERMGKAMALDHRWFVPDGSLT